MLFRNGIEYIAKYIPVYWLLVGFFTAVLKYFGYQSMSLEAFLVFFSFIIMAHVSLYSLRSLILTSILIVCALLKLLFINEILIASSYKSALTWCFLFSYAFFCSKRIIDEQIVLIILQKIVPFLLIVAILQIFFSEYLPDAFIEIPVINEDFLKTNYQIDLNSLNFVQPNGLYSNPIVFSTTMAFFFGILFHFKPNGYIITCIMILSVILASLSRTAIGMIGVILIVNIYNGRNIFFPLLSISLLFSVAYFEKIKDIFQLIYDRFILEDINASNSNIEHLSDFASAFEYILSNPISGIGFYEYVYKDIITDGAFLIMILELGLIASLLIIFILIYKVYVISRLSSLYAITMLVFVSAGLINSALINTSTAVIFIYFLFSRQSSKI